MTRQPSSRSAANWAFHLMWHASACTVPSTTEPPAGRTAQNQADRSRQTDRADVLVVCNVQPGPHGQPVRQLGRVACIGRITPKIAGNPANYPGIQSERRFKSVRLAEIGTFCDFGNGLGLCRRVFHRPVRCFGTRLGEHWHCNGKCF